MSSRTTTTTIFMLALVTFSSLLGISDRIFGQSIPNNAIKRPSSPQVDDGVVVVNRCQIKLIDQVKLAAMRSGVIEFVEPIEGQFVEKNQEVARLKDNRVRAELNTAEMQATSDVHIRHARETHEFARLDLKKVLDAIKQVPKTFSEIEIEEKQLKVKESELQIEQAEFARKVHVARSSEIRESLEEFSVRAPFDGRVKRVLKQAGEAIREGDTILEITSNKRFRIEGFLSYQDAWRVNQGDPVEVQLDLSGTSIAPENQVFIGNLRFVGTEVDGISKEVRVWAEVHNVHGLDCAGLEATMVIKANNPRVPKTLSNGS